MRRAKLLISLLVGTALSLASTAVVLADAPRPPFPK